MFLFKILESILETPTFLGQFALKNSTFRGVSCQIYFDLVRLDLQA